MPKTIIEMKGISKAFPGVQALQDCNLNVQEGEVHALLGENGAGKSTLMKVLTGIYHADCGEIFFDGKKVTLSSVIDARDLGITMIHQDVNSIPAASLCAWCIILAPKFCWKQGKCCYVIDLCADVWYCFGTDVRNDWHSNKR